MSPTPHALTVLIAEDDPAALKALEIVLTKKYPNAAFYFAIDGKTGLEYFKEYLPDIVITDLIMPGMGGYQLAREIRTIKADTKLIVLTGLNKMSDHVESLMAEIKFDHRIFKPVYFENLFAAIDQCVAEIDNHR